MGYIYVITTPSGKSYVGQTKNDVNQRFKKHRTNNGGCIAIQNAILKYGWDMCEKVWFECDDTELNAYEIKYINLLDTMYPNGYNLKEGGVHGVLSLSSRMKISASLKGRPLTEETKRKMSLSRKGIVRSVAHGNAIGEAKKKNSDECIMSCLMKHKNIARAALELGVCSNAVYHRIKISDRVREVWNNVRLTL